jgi:hypothetical protein
MGLLEQDSGSSLFSLSEATLATDSWAWVLFTDDEGRSFRHDFHLEQPGTPQDLEGDSSEASDVIALRWLPVQDAGVRGYNVYRSLAPAGPFSKINDDLVERTSYYRDAGLGVLTKYYYRVTTVDSSLVEGLPSLTVGKFTAPPELEPFPLPFASETSGHCAVGDVDSDGMLEIVLGGDEVYVWKADGEELFDGDNDAQTHGPITNLSSSFGPAGIALADLDNEPGLEMIVCETGADPGVQNAVHILRYDGTELPGWPQMLRTVSNGWAWATPAVGDVDGDGQPEIVVNTLDSRTWVWHVDGSELRDGDGDPATNGVFLNRGHDNEWTTSSPALFDLDGDGAKEIIFGTKYGYGENYLLAYRYDGTQAAGFPYTVGNSILCSPAVADLNGDQVWEIVAISQNNRLHVVQQDGSSYSGFPITFTSNTSSCPSPALGDFDGDGDLEIAALSTISTTQADLYVIDTDIGGGTSGQPLPGWPRSLPGNSEASPVVADVDGDGVVDILHAIGGGDTESPNNLYGFKANGNPLDGFPLILAGPGRASPVICDLDRDGDTDIVYGSWGLLIHVWDLPSPFDQRKAPWPTFDGHFYRDGVYRSPDLVDVPSPSSPARLTLLPPYPNPFNPSTTIRLYVPGTASGQQKVEVGVYDLRGRLVSRLHAGPAPSGWHTWHWLGRDDQGRRQASGLYFVRARAGAQTIIQKALLVK